MLVCTCAHAAGARFCSVHAAIVGSAIAVRTVGRLRVVILGAHRRVAINKADGVGTAMASVSGAIGPVVVSGLRHKK